MRGARQQGFTLVELMIGVVVLALVTLVGIPEMRSFVASQRTKAAASDLYSAMVFARSEAVKRNAGVAVVPVAADWGKGWSVRLASDGTVLRTRGALGTVAASGPGTGISYIGNGRLFGGAERLELSANHGAIARCVTISTNGRPRILVNSCS